MSKVQKHTTLLFLIEPVNPNKTTDGYHAKVKVCRLYVNQNKNILIVKLCWTFVLYTVKSFQDSLGKQWQVRLKILNDSFRDTADVLQSDETKTELSGLDPK